MAVQEARLGIAMNDLNEAQAELDAKQAELDAVQAQYEKAVREKQVSLHNLSVFHFYCIFLFPILGMRPHVFLLVFPRLFWMTLTRVVGKCSPLPR